MGGVGGEDMGVAPPWVMEGNSGVRGHVRAAQEAPQGVDRQTDRQTICPLYDDVLVCHKGCSTKAKM